jgi:hypothetical protein
MLHSQLQAEAVAPRELQRCERVLGMIDWTDGVYDVFPDAPQTAYQNSFLPDERKLEELTMEGCSPR